MRALCGSIIAAGALIGLGLTALAYGLRFQGFGPDAVHPDSHQLYGVPSLAVILVILILSVLIGLGIAFVGLMYHHERRQHELHGAGASHTTTLHT